MMHHHGRDGRCHSGPGGMFGCDQCDLDNYRAAEAAEQQADDEDRRRSELGDAWDGETHRGNL